MKHVAFTGGGSAGHVVPTFGLIRRLISEGVEVSFIGTRSGLEAELVEPLGIHYYAIASGKLRRYFSWRNLVDVFKVLAGLFQALVLMGRIRPDRVFSKGGFVSFPVVLAAWLWRIPVVAHESDLTPGLANRLALPFVHTLCVSFPDTRPKRFTGRLVVSGSPVREELLCGSAERGRTLLAIREGMGVVLVTGGSLGADIINAVVFDALPALLLKFDVVHICGPGKKPGDVPEGYHVFEFVIDHWGDYLAAADVIVSRAGANSLFETLALGKPNVLVPLSRKASRGDQIENARFAEQAGYSTVVAEEDFTPKTLLAALDTVTAQAQQRDLRFELPDTLNILYQALSRAGT